MELDIIAFSDTHNDHDNLKLPSADIAIHAGDACIKGNFTEVKNFLQWYVKQPFKYKIYVPGNHDKKMYTHKDLKDLSKEYGIYVLYDDLITIEGVRIYGNATTFTSEDRIEPISDLWDKKKIAWCNIQKNIDILVTHIPPKGILDQANRGANIGCSFLRKTVENINPKIHIFGHCHEDQGKVFDNGRTKFMNVACKDRSYVTTDIVGTKIEL